mgnify:CR=1 FL=1|tara:strand:- start:4480 stop:5589 length:1110 start_codon:yes stop_codon:yes gene_type:complete
MKNDIERLLRETPGLKGRQIAKKLGVDKREINSYLSKQEGLFYKDENYCWFIAGDGVIEVKLTGKTWIDGLSLDKAIGNAGFPLESSCHSILFIVPEGCKILLEAAARLLAISNQSIYRGKAVTIDFNDCQDTLSYFNRMGFFDLLSDEVIIKPSRPTFPSSIIYKGKSEAVYEFGEVDLVDLDENVPQRLKNSFVHHAGEDYSQPAFTVLSELFGNVRDHSESPIPGYIALQSYRGFGGSHAVPPHIQTIISDSGKGITGTLIPILAQRYPNIYKEFDFSDPSSRPLLVKEVFKRGGISQFEEEGHGLGLKRSGDVAANYSAKISVREDNFELKLSYREGKLASFSYELDLPRMMGCHICFDFILASR